MVDELSAREKYVLAEKLWRKTRDIRNTIDITMGDMVFIRLQRIFIDEMMDYGEWESKGNENSAMASADNMIALAHAMRAYAERRMLLLGIRTHAKN